MKAKDMIRQLIREELQSVLQEQSKNWWHAPAAAEEDAHLKPSEVHEQGNTGEKPRVRKGQRVAKGRGARYVSAGTIPKEYNPPRGLDQTKVNNRKEIGDKMLNAHARKSPSAAKFRQRIKDNLKRKGKPTDLMHQYSQIWAWASGMAANGSTSADWSLDNNKTAGKRKAKKKAAKTKKKISGKPTPTQTPTPPQTPPTPEQQ